MSRSRTLVFLALFLIGLVSCVSGNTSDQAAQVQPPAPTSTPAPTFTPSPSAAEAPTVTPTETPIATTAPEQATISGRILDQDSGQPVADALVSAGAAGATTGADGRYTLTDLPPGQYVLSVTHPDYDPGLSSILTVAAGEGSVVDVPLYEPDTSPYPEDPMLTNPLDPNGAPTEEDAERLAREQGLTGEVVSIRETKLSGELLVNYRIGDDIRAAVAEVRHEAWELVDEAGREWWIIKVCGNLASRLPGQVPIPTPAPKPLPPMAEVLADGLVVRECVAEDCGEVGALPGGERVEVYGCLAPAVGDWCEVGWSGGRGWCTGQSLRQLAVATVIPETAATPVTPGIQSDEIRLDSRNVPMVYVPSGPFTMGKNYADPGGLYTSEHPAHTVVLNAFYIDLYEVTNDQFSTFLNEHGNETEGGVTWLDTDDEEVHIHMQDGSWQPDEGYANHPVVDVSWYGARTYCQWRGARLPTEAEWEKAARGTDERIFPWGNSDFDCSRAHIFGCKAAFGRTTPVGSHPNGASPYGAHDMGGNVYEWVNDWFDPQYYRVAPRHNPVGPAEGSRKVVRGGSFYYGSPDTMTRHTEHLPLPPDTHRFDLGFRCVQ